MTVPVYKLGKLPKPDTSKLPQLVDYVSSALPKAPVNLDLTTKVPAWPMYANDTLGDCTCAAVGHQAQQWTYETGTGWTPLVGEVTDLYWATGKADTGRVEADVLKYWATQGFGARKDKISLFAEINPANKTLAKQATYLFGGLYLGVALPLSAQGQTEWTVTGSGADSQPGSWGGHAIIVSAYTASWVEVITWGQKLKMTWGFWSKYVDEAWAVLSSDWANGTANPINGFNYTQLATDFKAV